MFLLTLPSQFLLCPARSCPGRDVSQCGHGQQRDSKARAPSSNSAKSHVLILYNRLAGSRGRTGSRLEAGPKLANSSFQVRASQPFNRAPANSGPNSRELAQPRFITSAALALSLSRAAIWIARGKSKLRWNEPARKSNLVPIVPALGRVARVQPKHQQRPKQAQTHSFKARRPTSGRRSTLIPRRSFLVHSVLYQRQSSL